MPNSGVHATKACSVCGDQLDVLWLERHEKACKTRTPAERVWIKNARTRQRESYRASRSGVPQPIVKRKMGRPLGSKNSRPYHRANMNGRGRRLSATISVDFDTFRILIMQLAPSVTIDEVKLL